MDHSQSLMRNRFSLIHYTILKVVFCFSGILAPLSLVMMLFIPHNLNWIGYLIICLLLGGVAGCNVCGYIKLRGIERSMQLGNYDPVNTYQTPWPLYNSLDLHLHVIIISKFFSRKKGKE
ncbi:hypothetical protein OSB04_020390 [Centaurea solstitialis]|uniref:Uncharacterized protein n=1 Tax=Centaurea solstitialis TaxID=347529 RepID=A0AA38W5U6_9ASTR|nr:hypothetical protein OSB04_020390 [Centaurea solstitialis]